MENGNLTDVITVDENSMNSLILVKTTQPTFKNDYTEAKTAFINNNLFCFAILNHTS
jgi:hypothetical protein